MRIICVDKLDCRYPVVALVRVGDNYEDTGGFTKDGAFSEHGVNDSDLFFVPEKKEGWINIYHYDGIENANAARRIYDTKEEALACGNKGLAEKIVGADLLRENRGGIWSCARASGDSCYIALSDDSIFSDIVCEKHLCVPCVLNYTD